LDAASSTKEAAQWPGALDVQKKIDCQFGCHPEEWGISRQPHEANFVMLSDATIAIQALQ